MTWTWIVRPEQAWGDYAEAFADAVEAQIVALAEGLTDEITQWMKENARWTDRTGEARANLYSDVIHVVRTSVTILMSHGPTIEYSVWLELHPYYGILGDAVDHFAPLVFRRTREILHKVSAARRLG